VIEKLGNTMEMCDVDSVVIDKANNFITSPAYMKEDARPYQVYKGIEKMITETINRIKH
jgi:enhancing lycopene biosynthesis protein 2